MSNKGLSHRNKIYLTKKEAPDPDQMLPFFITLLRAVTTLMVCNL